MSDASLFSQFRQNLSVSNADEISTKYANITTRLNLDFWGIESDTRHSLQVGSYGRKTAIDGVSDLDMVFELPVEDYERYKKLEGNGPSTMLQEVRNSLLKRYPKSDVQADGQIVAVNFVGYRVEVLPAFLDENGDYIYGDTNDGGTWKLTKPRPEIKAVNDLNSATNGNLKDACKMLRAWKNKVGVGIGGLLIDTLTYNFFNQTDDYDNAGWADFPAMFVSLFAYLGGLDPDQEYWAAPGSGQRVKRKAKFQSKAKKAAAHCQEAIGAEGEAARAKIWRKLFGNQFPKAETVEKSARHSFDKEEFIEDRVTAVDIRYNIELDCEVREGTTLQDMLRRKVRNRERVPVGRHLRFFITECNVPGSYQLLWKVRNRGQEAINREMLRGEITPDKGSGREKIESTDFPGNHYVEVYAVKDGVCVARERIPVLI
jgi:Second Messenger Oligonucleotide or Dinucleotide Synthetase domain/Adenylyl/Guanylyl and SMODS C-terminal sensor domain